MDKNLQKLSDDPGYLFSLIGKGFRLIRGLICVLILVYSVISPTDQLTMPLDNLDTGDIHFVPFKIAASAKEDILNHLADYADYLHLSASSLMDDDIRAINTKYFNNKKI